MAHTRVPRNCEFCGKEFPARLDLIKIGGGRFCGRPCTNRGRDAKPRASRPIEDRFWEKVDKTPGQGPQGECWEWIASRNDQGYGYFSRFSQPRAHRASWEIHNGVIPDGLDILHRCDNPPCVRPDHLFTGTNEDNMKDMVAKGRAKAPTYRRLDDATKETIRRMRNNGASVNHTAKVTGASRGSVARLTE